MGRMTMSGAEREAFLAEPRIGVLAIAEGTRGPLTVPVWYDYRPGGELRFVTGRASRKGRLLAPGVRVSLCVQTETVPYKYLSVEGPVIEIATSDVERDTRPMARRYLGREGGDGYIEYARTAYAGQEEILVRVRVERWLSVDFAKELGAGA
jgi:hypothetical protein